MVKVCLNLLTWFLIPAIVDLYWWEVKKNLNRLIPAPTMVWCSRLVARIRRVRLLSALIRRSVLRGSLTAPCKVMDLNWRLKLNRLRILLTLHLTWNRLNRYCRLLVCRLMVKICLILYLNRYNFLTMNARRYEIRRLLEMLSGLLNLFSLYLNVRIGLLSKTWVRCGILTYTWNVLLIIVRLLLKVKEWRLPLIIRLIRTRSPLIRLFKLKVLTLCRCTRMLRRAMFLYICRCILSLLRSRGALRIGTWYAWYVLMCRMLCPIGKMFYLFITVLFTWNGRVIILIPLLFYILRVRRLFLDALLRLKVNRRNRLEECNCSVPWR